VVGCRFFAFYYPPVDDVRKIGRVRKLKTVVETHKNRHFSLPVSKFQDTTTILGGGGSVEMVQSVGLARKVFMLEVRCHGFLLFVSFVFLTCTAFSLAYMQQIERGEVGIQGSFPPNDHDFYALLSEPGNRERRAELFFDIVNKQNSAISKDALLKLVEARQKSISSFRCKYTVFIEVFDKTQGYGTDRKVSYEFGWTGDKLYLDNKPAITSNRTPRVTKAYDGEKVLSLLSYGEGHLHAGLEKADAEALRVFFQPYMPLTLSMLFDTGLCKFDQVRDVNLLFYLQEQKRLFGIFEKKETVAEFECIVVADLSNRIYLVPQKDFSVAQSETYKQEFSNGVLSGRWLASRSTLFDLVDHGNGVWIPSKAVIEIFDKSGKIALRYSVDVSLVEVNKRIGDDYFTGFIPDGTLVADVADGLVYRYGERASINSLIKQTAKSKRVWTFQIISLTLGILLILAWIIIQYRGHLQRKNAG